jgi:hypothetical protein
MILEILIFKKHILNFLIKKIHNFLIVNFVSTCIIGYYHLIVYHEIFLIQRICKVLQSLLLLIQLLFNFERFFLLKPKIKCN